MILLDFDSSSRTWLRTVQLKPSSHTVVLRRDLTAGWASTKLAKNRIAFTSTKYREAAEMEVATIEDARNGAIP